MSALWIAGLSSGAHFLSMKQGILAVRRSICSVTGRVGEEAADQKLYEDDSKKRSI